MRPIQKSRSKDFISESIEYFMAYKVIVLYKPLMGFQQD